MIQCIDNGLKISFSNDTDCETIIDEMEMNNGCHTEHDPDNETINNISRYIIIGGECIKSVKRDTKLLILVLIICVGGLLCILMGCIYCIYHRKSKQRDKYVRIQ